MSHHRGAIFRTSPQATLMGPGTQDSAILYRELVYNLNMGHAQLCGARTRWSRDEHKFLTLNKRADGVRQLTFS